MERRRFTCDGRKVPFADIRRSFDHLVGATRQRDWEGEAKRLGCLEVDDGGFGHLSITTGIHCANAALRVLRCPRSMLRLALAWDIDALGFGDVGKCAIQITLAIKDNGAIDIRVREAGIERYCQIEIGECKV
jgi:hypothetical protein